MGWSGGTRVLDQVVYDLKANDVSGTKFFNIVWNLICELEDMDWDLVQESDYWDDDEVRGVLKKMHPDWFGDDE